MVPLQILPQANLDQASQATAASVCRSIYTGGRLTWTHQWRMRMQNAEGWSRRMQHPYLLCPGCEGALVKQGSDQCKMKARHSASSSSRHYVYWDILRTSLCGVWKGGSLGEADTSWSAEPRPGPPEPNPQCFCMGAASPCGSHIPSRLAASRGWQPFTACRCGPGFERRLLWRRVK
jgi:hypothetical protein